MHAGNNPTQSKTAPPRQTQKTEGEVIEDAKAKGNAQIKPESHKGEGSSSKA